ncbi:beta-ketoacyl-[acyl-carrier-protein] synthase family protein [Ruminiclostridium josui]|uniref:beta-ketoacyl-[acyl-carrier-protein] synthase family protein n=1 Tax=Ruminiclostridium josui TaxID=1499 RepID=UPI00046701AF|nr:beta-ketoacyl-[acyl-carrier-protein] synthase family protein [Ruminiclostridium josui]
MHKDNQVVVTGIGLVTPLGCNYNEVWNSLLAGENGIRRLSGDFSRLSENQVYIGGVMPELPFHQLKMMNSGYKAKCRHLGPTAKMLIYAGLKALEDANLSTPDDTQRYNIGAVVGAGSTLAEEYDGIPLEDRNPKWFLETYPNLLLSHLASAASLKGFGCTILSACAGGNQAIGEAMKKIQRGEETVLLAGAVDNKLSYLHTSGFSRLKMCSTSDDPESAVKPFDKNRNGFVIGQGACMLVLESLSNALKRGADIKGRIVGYGNALDGGSLTDASYKGKIAAMQRALDDAGLQADGIGYINAHGTSTVSNDKEESIAIKEVFGNKSYEIPVSSTKSMIGHTFAACGAIEAFVCIKSLLDQRVHITRNFQEGDQFCNLDYVKGSARDVKMDYCISNTSGLGGYNSSLIFARV